MNKKLSYSKYRKFGIEIESSTEYNKIKQILDTKADFIDVKYSRVISGKSSTGKDWYLKYDTSTDCEVVSPAMSLSSQKFKSLKKLITILKKNNISITNRDGLHVHVEVNDITHQRMILAWLYLEKSVSNLFPKFRTTVAKNQFGGIHYAQRYIVKSNGLNNNLLADYYDVAKQSALEYKYMAMSMRNFLYKHTIEFRLSEGSIDWNHIDSWIKICLYIVDFAKNCNISEILNTTVSDRPDNILDAIDIKQKKIKDWINFRYMLYKN